MKLIWHPLAEAELNDVPPTTTARTARGWRRRLWMKPSAWRR